MQTRAPVTDPEGRGRAGDAAGIPGRTGTGLRPSPGETTRVSISGELVPF